MDFRFNQDSFPYRATARSAHDLADLLKRVRPDVRCEVDQLQSIVVRAHKRLDEAQTSAEIADAWCDLNAAFQALNALKHRNKS